MRPPPAIPSLLMIRRVRPTHATHIFHEVLVACHEVARLVVRDNDGVWSRLSRCGIDTAAVRGVALPVEAATSLARDGALLPVSRGCRVAFWAGAVTAFGLDCDV